MLKFLPKKAMKKIVAKIKFIFLCGLRDGKACGAPLTAIIRNTDVRPGDYSDISDVPRPGHADYTAHIKYGRVCAL